MLPKIIGISDDDTYIFTIPLKENVLDPAGRVILHTFEAGCNFRKEYYAEGVFDMLKTNIWHNAMLQFPIFVWLDTLPKMRQRVVELNQDKGDTFLDVYKNGNTSICEICVMATYASIFEADRYSITGRPCYGKEYPPA